MLYAAAAGSTFGIDNNIVQALLGFLGILLAAIVTQKYTARNARKANELQAKAQTLQEEVEDRKAALEQAKEWRNDTIELRRQRDEDRRVFEERMSAMEGRITGLTQKVEELTALRRDDTAYITQLTTWCKVVVVLLRQHNIPHPPVPPGVTDSNPRMSVVQAGGATAAGTA